MFRCFILLSSKHPFVGLCILQWFVTRDSFSDSCKDWKFIIVLMTIIQLSRRWHLSNCQGVIRGVVTYGKVIVEYSPLPLRKVVKKLIFCGPIFAINTTSWLDHFLEEEVWSKNSNECTHTVVDIERGGGDSVDKNNNNNNMEITDKCRPPLQSAPELGDPSCRQLLITP